MHATYIYSPKDNKYLEVVNSDRFGELFNVHIEVIGENKYNASFFHGNSLDKLPKWFTWWLEYTESGINCDAMLTAINNFREYIRLVTGENKHIKRLPDMLYYSERPLDVHAADVLKSKLSLHIDVIMDMCADTNLFNNEICAYKDITADAADNLYFVLETMFKLKIGMTGNVLYVYDSVEPHSDAQEVLYELLHAEICYPKYDKNTKEA